MTGRIFLPDEAATMRFAAAAAAALPAPGSPLIVYLEGELGTGKTSFARGMIGALGERGPVRSPTYGLLALYELPQGSVLHLDLYRLEGAGELEPLGLRDYLAASRLWLIEWPERVERGLPPPDARLKWAVEGTGRSVSISTPTEAGRQWLAGVTTGQLS